MLCSIGEHTKGLGGCSIKVLQTVRSLNSIFLKPETKQKKGSRHQSHNDVILPPYNLQLEMYFDIESLYMYVNGLKHNRHKGPNV